MNYYISDLHLGHVNAIGFDNGQPDEAGVELRRKDFMPRFSVDKQGRLFRVEVYRKQLFSGMFLVYFDNGRQNSPNGPRMARNADALPDQPGPESSLGF